MFMGHGRAQYVLGVARSSPCSCDMVGLKMCWESLDPVNVHGTWSGAKCVGSRYIQSMFMVGRNMC